MIAFQRTVICSDFQQGPALLQLQKVLNRKESVVYTGDFSSTGGSGST